MATRDWTLKNSYSLGLMTLGYVVGEIAHFLIVTSSRAVARGKFSSFDLEIVWKQRHFSEIRFGDKSCYAKDPDVDDNCVPKSNQTICEADSKCTWEYNGSGLQYQILAGPAFIAMFTLSSLVSGLTSDKIAGINRWIGRQSLMAAGVLLFSLSLFLMGLSTSYWQLVRSTRKSHLLKYFLIGFCR